MTTTGNTPAEGANPHVDHPAHYNSHPSGVECIEVVRHMSFNLGSVVKYIWRDGIKHAEVPLQDLEKAAWYLNDEIERRKQGDESVTTQQGAASFGIAAEDLSMRVGTNLGSLREGDSSPLGPGS